MTDEEHHHTAVWAAIDRIAERRGLTSSGLARLSGLDKTAFNLSKRTSRYGDRRRARCGRYDVG
mgnify:FL=1